MSTSTHAAAGTPKVEISDLHKFFGELHVLRGIDLTVPLGSVTVLIGPSGSGKSTLLRCINELESIDAGRVKVDGELIGMREVERGGRIELTPCRTMPGLHNAPRSAWSSSASTSSPT